MFCQRSLFKLSVCLVLLNLAITPALFSPLNNTVSARDVPQEKESDHTAIEIERKPQRVFAPHWTTEENFSTTIYIRNVHISQPTIARTSLILDHRTIVLPDTFVDSLQTVALDVKKALVESGEKPDQTGGAVIDFEAESAGAINAYAQVLDTTKSLSFSFPFMQDGAPAPGPLDAVAWYYNQNTNASIALQNTTDTETTVTLTIFVSGRTISLGDRHLNPHETKTINLPSPEGPANVSGPRSAGVRVEYEGKPGAVIAQGWVADESIGFSSPFAFHPKSNCNCADVTQHTYGAGIMFGKGGMSVPNAAPSADMIFSPNLAVRNRSDKPLTINPLFSYQADDKVKRVKLPAFSLIAQDSTVVNLREFQERGIIPSFVEMGNIDLQYTGDAGALVAELASVDQNGSFVSPVPLVCGGSPASHMSFWRTDGDWHSSVTIENIASQATDVEVTISYPGGTYVLEQKIGAGKAAMISINELQQSQQPDREGRPIPLNVTLGGVNIWSPDAKGGLVVNAMLMNPVTRTCGSCTQPGYALSWAVSDKEANASTPLYFGFDPRQVNQGFNIKLNVRWSLGSQGPTDPTSSTSSSPNVAIVSNTYGNTLNVGNTNITANGHLFTNASCNQTYDVSSTASLTVVPQVNVTEVGFTGDYQITQWSGGAVIDNPDGSAATWKSTSNPNYPVAYTKGALPTMFVKLAITPSASSTSAKIRVRPNPNNSLVIAKKNITISGTSVTITGITTNSALESTVKTATPSFTWEISYDGGTRWYGMGTSGPHTMYWTYAAPLSPPFQDFDGNTYAPLYDLALQKACGPANGTIDVATIVSRINQQVDVDVFYDPGHRLFGPPLNAYSEACLCADLASLLRGLIRSIGIDGSVLYKWGGTNSSTQTKYIIGSIGNQGVFNPTFMITRSSHDLAPSNPHYTYHAVVQVGSTLYDPSYGFSYASLSFAETALNNTTPQQTSTTFPAFYTQSGWVCLH